MNARGAPGTAELREALATLDTTLPDWRQRQELAETWALLPGLRPSLFGP